MSNLTLVEGETGWIVFDTLMSVECSKAALADRDIKVNYLDTDTGSQYLLRFKNGPLLHFAGMKAEDADLTIQAPRQALLLFTSGSSEKIKNANIASGDMDLLDKLCGAFTALQGAGKFNIVEP